MTTQNSHPTDARASAPGRGAMRRAMAARDFRLLFAGTSTSLLGDQFALIATPWLVLQLTNDPVALGLVLALEGLPRAAFMLLGGAVTDRFSARQVMIVADIVRAVLTAALAVAVLAGGVEMWMIYTFAAGFGAVAGLSIPAENSIVPTVVNREDLQGGNALVMGATQLSAFVGPTLAGIMIASYTRSTHGAGLAFAIDAVTFIVSAIAIGMIRGRRVGTADVTANGLWSAIAEAGKVAWSDPAMRFVFALLAAVNLLLVGPLLVGIPIIAHHGLAEGAAAFGALMASFAIGNLAGYLAAGASGVRTPSAIRRIVIGAVAAFGAATCLLIATPYLWIDIALLASVGFGNGYVAILLFTWVQARTPERMLGRTMSLVTFASVGLVSVSQAVAGATAAAYSVTALMIGAGALVLLTSAWAATQPGLRAFAGSLAASRITEKKE